ncbi:MAG: SnoaL-like domain-containing protein [Gammaproteobacteria bacterium]|jgi:hypothetical protein|nr:SnoaL-like domain-containing protein [Gammaproteobacteria bacterium]MBT5600720.1 SnoaL-like domain-containing protein [Gammaproteobacteria bacterium]MBT6246627.1 SnoaL-like domain-containing protein [Gammaproteobacteria bacterium]
MNTLDSRLNWQLIDSLLEDEQDPWRVQMLSQLKQHMQAECGGALEELMATMVPEPIFHNWSGTTDSGAKGATALKAFYSGLISSGSNQFQYSIERIIIGDDTLVTEGKIQIPFTGEMLQAMGKADAKANCCYATEGRTVTFWPFSADGKIIGEDIYSTTTDLGDAEEVTLNPYIYGESI